MAPFAGKLRTENVPAGDRLELVRELRQESASCGKNPRAAARIREWAMPKAGFTDPLLSWSLPDQEEWQDLTPEADDWDDCPR